MREWVDNGNVVNGVVLDQQSLARTPFTGVPLSTLRRTGGTPRVDYQLSTNHTLTIRYSYSRDAVENAGVGGFNLVSRGFHSDVRSQTVQATETAVLGSNVRAASRTSRMVPLPGAGGSDCARAHARCRGIFLPSVDPRNAQNSTLTPAR